MPDKVEDILKTIHVLFAKSEAYHGSPDRVVISKKQIFEVLGQLNEAIYEVLDQYEATSRSKERAKIEMDKHAAEVVAEARRSAEEVNAASLMYTDNMLNEVRKAVCETQKEIRSHLETLLERLDGECQYIDQNKAEIKGQLSELHDSDRYFKLLQEQRKVEQEQKKEDVQDVEEGEEESVKKAEIVVRVHKPGESSDVTVFNKKRGPKKTPEEKRRMLEELKRPEGDGKRGAAVGEPVDDDNLEGQLFFTADDFDLDREYYDWKGSSGEADSEKGTKKKWFEGVLGRGKTPKR